MTTDRSTPDSVIRPLPSAEHVIAHRSGDVLIKATVLKADHFPSCHNSKLTPILEGAPNFRKIEGLPVYGVAIPTVNGLRNVLNELNSTGGHRQVFWQNLREEPLIFINGQPFVVREADQPFSNLEYTGIDRSRVEEMEVRLKQDILEEAKLFNNMILVMHENADLSIYDHWEPVTPADVQTPQEVYAELKADGYEVDYIRIPVTDEKAPKDQDFEQLISRLWGVPLDAALIFNCQMGRGRTTTGMIIAALLHLRRIEAFPIKPKKPDTREVVPEWFRQLSKSGYKPPVINEADKLKMGMYGVIRSLMRALEKGPESKTVLDTVVDAASAMQNLREAIASYRTRYIKEVRERQKNILLSCAQEYLERYYMLIAFAGYLHSPQFEPDSMAHVTFPDWMTARTELRSILMRLLRRNSMAALEFYVNAGGEEENPSVTIGSPAGADKDKEKDVVASRQGNVLGPFSILKEDNFPGMRSGKVDQIIEGAPNFRQMGGGLRIYGLGMPTVDGVLGVLKMVSKSHGSSLSAKHVHALWINMREEPVVYINGKPFVLREEVRPLKNLQEYAGIEASRIESMEERLKKDVLAEALKFGGKILVAAESFEPGHYGELRDEWEEIDHPDAVQTTAEVYSSLSKQGFAVKYVRIPVTDGTTPTLGDFDSLMSIVSSFGLGNPVIFNCQLGVGRATTGMVIAGMVQLYSQGLSSVDSLRADSNLGMGDDEFRSMMIAGMSPRSDEDQDEDDKRDEDDEKIPKIWDVEPEELEEQKSLAAGGYVGVRRVVRLFEEGERCKLVVDGMADAASDLLNLRVAIMKYRKPRSSYKFMRPELQQRTAAFKKGSAYLERYCMLIACAFYLENVGVESGVTFSQWVMSRPDLTSALEAIQINPAAALAALPITKLPSLYQAGQGDVDVSEQKRVLSKRKGRTMGKRTILKSYIASKGGALQSGGSHADGQDVRKAQDLPIYSVGNIGLADLRDLLESLGAKLSDAKVHVIITDLREELMVYINGTAYTRRELEMPAAALHHAGIQTAQLEELEVLLKEDVTDEAASWGGRFLLHRELPPDHPRLKNMGVEDMDIEPSLDPSEEGHKAQKTGHGASPGAPAPPSLASAKGTDDVTALVDRNPGAAVAPFWEIVESSSNEALQTPKDLAELLSLSYSLSYCRVPLSRERTPEAWDIEQLHRQIDLAIDVTKAGKQEVVHLVMSRTASGSSARFVAAALASYYVSPPDPMSEAGGRRGQSKGGALSFGGAGSPPGSSSVRPGTRAPDTESGEYRGIMALCRLLPGGYDAKSTVDAAIQSCSEYIGDLLGDIRKCHFQTGKMGQPSGPSALPVGPGDAESGGGGGGGGGGATAVAQPSKPSADPVTLASKAAGTDNLQFAARQLGVHYLKRYFLLITYRTFLEKAGLSVPRISFGDWVNQQPEIVHLLHHLKLE